MANPMNLLAGPMGFEPTASGVTGRRYNQLNYSPVFLEHPYLTGMSEPSRLSG